MNRKLTVLLLFACCIPAAAQFVVDGNEKTSVRWNQIKTEDYRFVYPVGADSLARTYASEWEKWKIPVGHSIGRYPNEAYRQRMPVILHPYLGYSNGMVVWTPRRMEMYTGPYMASPEPTPWTTLLAIHEQRHVAQMQFVAERPYRWISPLFGELLSGPLSVIHFDSAYFEGDAVATETALTQAGRTRTADFLEYYRASTGEGQFRNYERWRYGSQRLYTPNYYTVGYLATGGMRAVYGKPYLMKDYYDWLKPYRKIVKRQTGLKFRKAFDGVLAVQDSLWRTDDSLRAPFQPMEQVTAGERYYVSYSGLAMGDGGIYALRSGTARNMELVLVEPEGRVKAIDHSAATSPLVAGNGRLYWSELIYDPRWEMHSGSGIRYLENGKTRTLVGKGRYFNPKYFEGKLLTCKTEFEGSARVVILDAGSGEELESWRAPDGLLPFEAVAIGGEIFCAAVTDCGEGIYRLPDFEPVLKPEFVKINHLFVRDDKLWFTSDRTGVNELYSLEDGAVLQHTTLKNGGQDFAFGPDGYLYFTGLRPSGRMIYRTPVDSLPVRRVEFSDVHHYELEDILSEQEEIIALRSDVSPEESVISESKHYSKALHAIKVHSWMPFFADYDELKSMSSENLTTENLTTALGLGATAFFQNDLNTLSGQVGYSARPGMFTSDSLWLHSAVVDVAYRGLYPVIEGKFTVNRFGVSSNLRTYVPINLSSGGWNRAIVPSLSFCHSPVETYAAVGIRAYSVLPSTKSGYFPHKGVGISLSLEREFTVGHFFPQASAYAYLPGLTQAQGLGLSASLETGPFVSAAVPKSNGTFVGETVVSAKYAIPFLSVDWNGLSPLTYVRNFEFAPKASFTYDRIYGNITPFYPTYGPDPSFGLIKAGADFDVVLGNIWFIPYNFRLGVSACYVWGSEELVKKPYEIKMIFSVGL